MKIKDLIKNLESLDQDLNVVFYSEDENLTEKGKGIRVLDLLSTSKSYAQLSRNDDGSVSISFGKGESSLEYAFLEITSDI